MGFYIVSISWGSSLGPLIGGYIIDGLGWRWQRWITAILVGINLGMVVFFVPETRFYRGINSTIGPLPVTKAAITSGVESQGPRDDVIRRSDKANGARKTVIQELNPWSGIDRNVSYLNLYLRPFPLVFYPACAFAALSCTYFVYQYTFLF